jgi:hypothetical protein
MSRHEKAKSGSFVSSLRVRSAIGLSVATCWCDCLNNVILSLAGVGPRRQYRAWHAGVVSTFAVKWT